MAQLQDTSITGSVILGTEADTGSIGNIWFDSSTNEIKYTYGINQPGVWSAGSAMTTGRPNLAGAGEQNASLVFGGRYNFTTGETEEYNGQAWSTGGALSTARYQPGGTGQQNAGLAFGGTNPSFTYVTCTEEYNGSSWTAGGALITSRGSVGGAGQQNAGLAFGGKMPGERCSCT